ncbi:LysR family transcriptional regulator substrate-binding protein [Streptomyces sp. NBS 14/10]|nr:LysR family transcriptional regulator substrate-binding protein [Streptomyces sp. NBS 14/10]KAK1186493.1 LysR family transcriptional regulator substrate-binding protein [Streptomyces sp. NBS 14/10]
MPGLLRLWREQLPHIEIRIFEGLDEEIEERLESGTVDAAVLIDPDPLPRGGLHLGVATRRRHVRRPGSRRHHEGACMSSRERTAAIDGAFSVPTR